MKLKLSSLFGMAIGVLLLIIFVQQPAMAYVGPGTGIAALGALIAIVVGVIAALFGFLWFPIKRLMKKRQQAAQQKIREEEETV